LHTEGDLLGLGLVRQPKTVLFGPGQRHQLGAVARGLAKRVLVVTDERMARSAEFAAMMDDLRAQSLTLHIYDRALPDLPRQNILDVVAVVGREFPAPEAVIGIGGGSCLDLAKVVSAVLANQGEVRDYFGEHKVPGPGLPVIAVPTTGGTGAEVTAVAVVFDDVSGMKMGVASPHLEPVAAIIDPELTITCPPGLTAATAADALSHLVESYTARFKNLPVDEMSKRFYVGKNRITDMFVREGLRLVNTALEGVVRNPSDLQARSDMMFAAYCAGMAINTTGTAAAHAIQGPIAGVCHAPHGFGVGALLPYVMRFNLPVRQKEFAEIGAALGVAQAARSEQDNARAAIERIEALLRTSGAPLDLKALGLEPKHFATVAAGAMKATRLTVNNPREMTESNVLGLLQRGYDGDLSWWVDP
jgi:alcohol dehydrogenase class IV